MSLFGRVLVPLDGSAFAESVLPQIGPLLIRREAEILLLQAVEPPVGIDGDVVAGRELIRARAEGYLGALASTWKDRGARVSARVRLEAAADAVLDAAAEEKATLIAMATHGRTGFSRWAFGSVAEKVLRASRVPLFLVRPVAGSVPAAELQVRRILVPIDLSERSLAIVPPAAELAEALGAEALILNVCGDEVSCDVPVLPMNRAYEEFRRAGVRAQPVMRKGDPAVQILEACKEHSADLIAMATHGRSGLSRWALGSVTEKVSRCAAVPLFVVRDVGTGVA
jgi:nucleotide-binding universal stress UspA family protein